MSKMNELFEKVAKDRELQAKYVEIFQNSLESGEDATNKKLIAFAKDAGYDIAIDEMKEYFKGMTASKEGELPDSDLEKVAGGVLICSSGIVPEGMPLAIGGIAVGCACFPSSPISEAYIQALAMQHFFTQK